MNEDAGGAEKIRLLGRKVYGATIKCGASLVFVSIGAGIGALFHPSTGQWIGKYSNSCHISFLFWKVYIFIILQYQLLDERKGLQPRNTGISLLCRYFFDVWRKYSHSWWNKPLKTPMPHILILILIYFMFLWTKAFAWSWTWEARTFRLTSHTITLLRLTNPILLPPEPGLT